MNIKRYIGATIAVFAFTFFYGWLVHGILLKGYYEATAKVWRELAEMNSMMPQHLAFGLAFSAWVTFIFSRFFGEEGGIKNGLLFGLYIGVLVGILAATWYVFVPIPKELAVNWFIANVVEGLGYGLILGLVYCNCAKKT